MNFGVLVSGSGTNLGAILEAQKRGDLGPGKVVVVISNRPGVGALERAERAGLPAEVVDHKIFESRAAFETQLAQRLRHHQVDSVVLAGFMRMLGPEFLGHFPDRVVNIHPALLPAFPGVHAPEQAYAYGVKVSGVTIHFVDEGMDSGPIIAQQVVRVRDDDTAETLRSRILGEEHRLYPQVLRALAEGRVHRSGRHASIAQTPYLRSKK